MGTLFLMIILIVIILFVITPLLSATQDESSSYKLIFGGMLGQELVNSTKDDADISTAIKVRRVQLQFVSLQKRMKSNTSTRYATNCMQIALEQIYGGNVESHCIKAVTKQRLLVSLNGTHPHKFKQHFMSRNGQLVVQNIQLVLGLLYHVSVSHLGGEHLCKECRLLEHDFIITRDRNKEFHIFQHTTKHSELMVSGSCKLNWDRVVVGKCTCSLMSSSVNGMTSVKQEIPPPWSYDSDQCYAEYEDIYSSLYEQTFENGRISVKANQNTDHQIQRLRPLRLATYNIWNVNSISGINESYEDRINRLGEFIRSLDIDIFGFQEVRLEVFHHSQSKKSLPQVSHLTKYLIGYQYIYQPAMLYTDRLPERSEEGVAIFSRYPIVSSDYILLFRNTTDEVDSHQRICLHAEILAPYFGTVHVFVTHLSLSKKSQERSVMEIWKYMDKFSGLKLLMGDFNTEPYTTAIRFLTGETSLQGLTTQGLCDTWTAVDSNRNKNGFTFSALDKRPVKRIDYIFFGQSDPPLAKVQDAVVINSDKFCNIPCSDHLTLVTQILPIISEHNDV